MNAYRCKNAFYACNVLGTLLNTTGHSSARRLLSFAAASRLSSQAILLITDLWPHLGDFEAKFYTRALSAHIIRWKDCHKYDIYSHVRMNLHIQTLSWWAQTCLYTYTPQIMYTNAKGVRAKLVYTCTCVHRYTIHHLMTNLATCYIHLGWGQQRKKHKMEPPCRLHPVHYYPCTFFDFYLLFFLLRTHPTRTPAEKYANNVCIHVYVYIYM